MNEKINFFRGVFLLCKKDLKLYGSRALSWLALLALLTVGTAAALCAVVAGTADDGDASIRMAIYDREPSAATSNAIYAVSKLKSVSELFKIEMCDSEEDARRGMENGNYDAALIFEEGYFAKVLDGDDSAVTILLSDKLTALSDIIKHFAKTGEKLIRSAEAGIEGLYSPLEDDYPSAAVRKTLNKIEKEFALKLFALSESGFDINTVLHSAYGVGKAENYILCYTVFLLILCEVIFFTYTAADCETSLLRRIKSYRISNLSIAAEKAILPFLIRATLFALILTALGNITDVNLSLSAVLTALFGILLLSVILSSISVLLSASPLGISVIFALGAANLLLCGGIIPSVMLPHAISAFAKYTPMEMCMQMLAPLFFGKCGGAPVLMLTAMALAFTLLAALRLRYAERGGGKR